MRTPPVPGLTWLQHAGRSLHRWTLIHRRGLAALLVGVAVFAGLRAVRPPDPVLTPSLVAARDLPAGTRLVPRDLTRVGLSARGLPEGRLTDPVGAVLAAPVRRGEILTDARVLGPGLTSGMPGLVALPVRLSDPDVVALLRVGDPVDLIAVPVQEIGPSGGVPGTGARGRVVAERVRVLAIPPAGSAVSALGSTGRLVVLGVSEGAVIEVSEAAAREWLSVALRE